MEIRQEVCFITDKSRSSF